MTLDTATLLARASAPDADGDADPTRTRILDAALDEAAAGGLARVSVEAVVRRSGLGRMTVYRRFERRDDLLDALAVRETRRFLDAVAAGLASADDVAGATVEGFVAGMAFVRAHPLLRPSPDRPADVIATVAANDGVVLQLGTAFIAARLHGARRGRPARSTRWTAEVLARLFVTYVAIPPADPAAHDDRQLRAFARHALVPIASGARAPEGSGDR